MVKDFYIPVENKVREFKHHLECHPRIILSAKFGDGKSYFLKKFCEDKSISQEYEFITIYPVNYQVLDNADVFDILKRDIILQMGAKGMIGESETFVSEEMALLYCIKNKGLTLFEALLDVAANSLTSNIGILGKFCQSAVKLLKTFNDAKKKFEDLKKTDIDMLIERVSKITIDEEDLYSRIIKLNLEEWRNDNRKKVCLIIEDMDRLDPAHVFRILNVLSAQLDSCYYSVEYEDVHKKNKLGFDNVVLVMHYNNLENIYRHVYGDGVDFDGYVSKFVTGDRFSYSLAAEKMNYFYDVIVKSLCISKGCVEKLIPSHMIGGLSLRDLAKALVDLEKQLVEEAKESRIMRLLVVMYRLTGEIDTVNSITKAFGADYNGVMKELAPVFYAKSMIKNHQMMIHNGEQIFIYSFNYQEYLHFTKVDSTEPRGAYKPLEVARGLVECIHR